jgi:hypothetical protein
MKIIVCSYNSENGTIKPSRREELFTVSRQFPYEKSSSLPSKQQLTWRSLCEWACMQDKPAYLTFSEVNRSVAFSQRKQITVALEQVLEKPCRMWSLRQCITREGVMELEISITFKSFLDQLKAKALPQCSSFSGGGIKLEPDMMLAAGFIEADVLSLDVPEGHVVRIDNRVVVHPATELLLAQLRQRLTSNFMSDADG